nr:MAG TPA: hypothetical protein [Caudoviricetes sp.]
MDRINYHSNNNIEIFMEKETIERTLYRHNCKYFSYENCMKKSGWYGGMHLLMGCDGDCRRMKNYDKKV